MNTIHWFFPFILFVYLVSSFLFGQALLKKLSRGLPILLEVIGSWLIGTLVTVPITYLFACLIAGTGESILYSCIVTSLLSIVVAGYAGGVSARYGLRVNALKTRPKQARNLSTAHCLMSIKYLLSSDFVLVIFSLAFSTWLMTKTFHGGIDGQLFVGSNNIFDFGHAIGLIRSMSWGGNIPFLSPFYAGLPFFYHFFFIFYTAILEYFGVPIVWALNIPSIFSFTALLTVVYFIPQVLFGRNKLTGWIAVLLTITHSTFAFWQYIFQKGLSILTFKSIWQLPTYPFAGPFDGSVISIFMTLNNFVNQRHLAFALASGFFLLILFILKMKEARRDTVSIASIGFLSGLLFLWNIPICGLVLVSAFGLAIFQKMPLRLFIVFSISYCLALLFPIAQYFSEYQNVLFFIRHLIGSGSSVVGSAVKSWNPLTYLVMNVGMLPGGILIGYIALNKKNKTTALPFVVLFTLFCVASVIGNRGFDQKVFSFIIIFMNVLVAVGLSAMWKKKFVLWKSVALFLFFVLTISGILDLFPIKNEFAYPLVGKETLPVVQWIHSSTPKNAVFVSYRDMIDPVVLSGRTNYYGFYGNVGWGDRSEEVKNIYAGDLKLANELGVAYILAPKWEKSDFPYIVDTMYFREHRHLVYEDEKYVIFQTDMK